MEENVRLVDSAPNLVDPNAAPAVFCLVGVDRDAVFARLGGAAAAEAPLPLTPSALAPVMESGRKAVLVFREAEEYLVAAMISGRSPTQVLTDWSSEIAQMLQARSKSRRQIFLVRDSHLLQGKAEDLELLQQMAALPLGSAPILLREPVADGFYWVLARQLLATSPRAQALGLELEASSLPWAPEQAVVDIDLIYEQRQRMLARPEVPPEALTEAETRQALLRDQIAQLQAELVAQAGRNGALSRESVVDFKQAALDAKAEISELRARVSEYDKNCDVLHQEIEQLRSQLQSETDRELALQQYVTAVEAQRDEILRSHSWKITRPLRALKEMFGGATSKKIE